MTRIYKLYLFAWLLPYVALVHIAILVVTLRLIRRARLSGKLALVLFHADGVGGLGFVPGLVTTPIIVTLLMGAVPTAAAFEVHRALDITPLVGLTIIVLSVCIAYIIPILFLRSDIIAMKRQMIAKLRVLQQAYYLRIIEDRELNFETLRNGNEAFSYFDKVRTAVQSISDYPHLKRIIGCIGLALTPSVMTLAVKLCEDLIPVVRPILRRP